MVTELPPQSAASRPAPTSGRLRLCRLKRWRDFDGYGFVLIAEKTPSGSFVGHVDDWSPAEAGGLRPGDRLIEINGVNVETEPHSAITERIMASADRLELLVVDDASDRYIIYYYAIFFRMQKNQNV